MDKNSKIHFFYIVGILLAIIIILLTNNLGANDKVLNYTTFAMAISSILLAIITIIYSFFPIRPYQIICSGLLTQLKKYQSMLLI
jgi:hypothetical protein